MKYAPIRRKEEVGEKRSTVDVHRDDCLLKNTPTIYVQLFFVCLYIWIAVDQDRRVEISLTSLSHHIFVHVPSHDIDFERHMSWLFCVQ